MNRVLNVVFDKVRRRVFGIWVAGIGERKVRCGAGRREDGVSVFREVVSLRYFVLCCVSVV